MKIKIAEKFSEDFVTRNAGEKLRNLILQSENPIVLDFLDTKIASASFLDEGIAKLVDYGWTQNDYDHKLHFENMFHMDQSLLKQVCKERGKITIKL
ncbi:MAG: STAS-like domain-containing protein [Bdellovibrionales bacterium]|nr:STAS-like domain-containing protein [Bdellovibrionales bacterium]